MIWMLDRRPDTFARLTREHLREAARRWNDAPGYPPFRKTSQRWEVIIDRRRYPPKAITALAHDLAGLGKLTPKDFSGAEQHGFLHDTLRALGLKVEPKRRVAAVHTRGPMGRFIAGPRPKPGDIGKSNVRAAARHWDASGGFENFGNAKRFHVWIDAVPGGIRKPYPPKAIAALAARDAGKRPLRTNEFSGLNNGGWHRQFRTLGFPVLPIGELPDSDREASSDAVSIVVGKQGRNRGTALTKAALQEAMRVGEPVSIPMDPTDLAIERLLKRGRLPTEAKRQIRARLGQGTFRAALLSAYGECALTGETTPQVLRAAHIQRWADCEHDPKARLDLHNGLLLTANLDCLFEVGMIAIDSEGRLLISEQLDNEARARFGIHVGMPVRWPMSERRAGYLMAHRKRVGFEPDDEDDEDPDAVARAFAW